MKRLHDAADVAHEAYWRGWRDAWAKAKAAGIEEGIAMAADWKASKVAPERPAET